MDLWLLCRKVVTVSQCVTEGKECVGAGIEHRGWTCILEYRSELSLGGSFT